MGENNNENIGDEFIIQNKRKTLSTTTIKRETQQQVPPIFELLLNSDESSSASLRSATVWGEEKCIVRCAIGEESRRAFIPSTLLLHKNGKKVGIIEEESGGSIAYEFIPWEEENKKLNKQNIKKPILFHCSAEIFPDEAKLLRKGRRHFPQITNKNVIYQRTLKMTPKIGTIPCENNYNKCKNGGLCFEMNNNGSKFCLCPEKYGGRYCEQWIGNGIFFKSTFLPISTICLTSLIAFLLLIIIILSLFLIKEKRKLSKKRKNIIKFEENGKIENNSINLNEKENESTPLEYFYNKEDDPFDNKFLTVKENQQKQQQNNYLLPLSPIPSIASPSLSRIPRLYSTPQIKRTTKEIDFQEKEEINFEEEKHSNSSNNQSSESGGEYDNLQKLCEEIQKQKNVLETKRMECKQNNNGGSAYMNLILLGKGENE
uniref:EGF-like domain-containing protein n=1 Tax=Meloidogyne enterolobii TaxID=390850 RepID=A0A6V7TZM5_MELEN|nr:unnamed protein product [Meloidogyne enterolobii]